MAKPQTIADATRQEFPRRVIESVTTRPFKGRVSGTVAAAGTPVDIVRVENLRRVEATPIIVTGVHDGLANAAALTDTTATFISDGVEVGDIVLNVTDGSQATITGVTETVITGILAGGAEDDWDIGDTYRINKNIRLNDRSEEIRDFSIVVSEDAYLRIDADASSTNYDCELAKGDEWHEANWRVAIRISMVNKGAALPSARGSAAGV